MFTLLQDLRYGFRMLLKARGFTVAAVLTLALGIGANTAIFSVVHAVLLRTLPYQDSDRLVMVFENKYNREHKKNVVNPGNFMAWRERAKSFEHLSGMVGYEGNVAGIGDPLRASLGLVTYDLVSTAGVQPLFGRLFSREDAKASAANVVLISEPFWRKHFGNQRDVIGRSITVEGDSSTIIGVLPASFQLPGKVDVWMPWSITEKPPTFEGRFMLTVGRLKPGVTLAQAQSEMDVIARSLEQEHPNFDFGWSTIVVPLREQIVGEVRPALLILLGAVGLVLLIACLNVANLLMIRGAARSREIAIRIALGVSRRRLARQLLTESVLLAFMGGIVGVLFAIFALEALLAIAPAGLPRMSTIAVNFPVLAFTLVLSLGAGILFGLGPAMQAMRSNWNRSLSQTGRTSGAGSPRSNLRSALVVVEAALAMMLLVGAGLLIRSFLELMRVDPGFRAQNVLTTEVELSGSAYKQEPKQVAFFEQAVERTKSLPGVDYAGAISYLPLAGAGSATGFSVDGTPPVNPADQPVADVRSITSDYFRAMGTPLLQGRFFNDSDRADDPVKKVIINETMARDFWPNQNPIGKRITMPWGADLHAEVIGVVRDVTLTRLESAPRTTLYWYLPQFPYSGMTIVAHAKSGDKSLAASMRSIIAFIDPQQPVGDVVSMEEVLGDSVKAARFTMTLLVLFACCALALASVGLYGVISYLVAQRTNEFGIRMAFGAHTADISRMVLGEGMRLIFLGIAAGLCGSLLLTRLLATMLFRVPSTDIVTFAAVCLLLMAVALTACYIPARRATRIDPMAALRYE